MTGEPEHDIFDPFDHGGAEAPNLIRTDDAVMLQVHRAAMVDPDDATSVIVERAAAAEDPGRLAESSTLALIGAPGSGKSTVGALVAERLGLAFIDVDTTIEAEQGRAIAEIFADDGESAFRRMEVEATLAALDGGDRVVSLGGGAVMSPKIRAALTDHPVVWLEVSASTAINRAGLNTARPLLMGNVRGTLMKLLAERTPVYQNLATVTVGNDGDDPAATADRVVAELAALRGRSA